MDEKEVQCTCWWYWDGGVSHFEECDLVKAGLEKAAKKGTLKV